MGRQHGALVTNRGGVGGGYPVGRGKTWQVTLRSLPSLSTKRKCKKTKTACGLAETNIAVSTRTHEQWRRPDSIVDRDSPSIGTP